MTTETTTQNSKTLDYVQDLHGRAKDGHQGYAKAVELAEGKPLKDFFAENSAQRAKFALELEGLLRMESIEPDDSATLAGRVHQHWMSLVSKVSKGDGKLLSECLRGEEAAISDYQNALDSMELAPRVAEVIERQRDRIKEEMKTLSNLEEFEASLS